MNFFLDANMPYSAKETFPALKLKVTHARDAGLQSATDEQIMAHAMRSKSILITKDLDFGKLAVSSKMSTYGIVILRLPFSYTASQIMGVLKTFLLSVDKKKLGNSLTVVEVGRYRIRKI